VLRAFPPSEGCFFFAEIRFAGGHARPRHRFFCVFRSPAPGRTPAPDGLVAVYTHAWLRASREEEDRIRRGLLRKRADLAASLVPFPDRAPLPLPARAAAGPGEAGRLTSALALRRLPSALPTAAAEAAAKFVSALGRFRSEKWPHADTKRLCISVLRYGAGAGSFSPKEGSLLKWALRKSSRLWSRLESGPRAAAAADGGGDEEELPLESRLEMVATRFDLATIDSRSRFWGAVLLTFVAAAGYLAAARVYTTQAALDKLNTKQIKGDLSLEIIESIVNLVRKELKKYQFLTDPSWDGKVNEDKTKQIHELVQSLLKKLGSSEVGISTGSDQNSELVKFLSYLDSYFDQEAKKNAQASEVRQSVSSIPADNSSACMTVLKEIKESIMHIVQTNSTEEATSSTPNVAVIQHTNDNSGENNSIVSIKQKIIGYYTTLAESLGRMESQLASCEKELLQKKELELKLTGNQKIIEELKDKLEEQRREDEDIKKGIKTILKNIEESISEIDPEENTSSTTGPTVRQHADSSSGEKDSISAIQERIIKHHTDLKESLQKTRSKLEVCRTQLKLNIQRTCDETKEKLDYVESTNNQLRSRISALEAMNLKLSGEKERLETQIKDSNSVDNTLQTPTRPRISPSTFATISNNLESSGKKIDGLKLTIKGNDLKIRRLTNQINTLTKKQEESSKLIQEKQKSIDKLAAQLSEIKERRSKEIKQQLKTEMREEVIKALVSFDTKLKRFATRQRKKLRRDVAPQISKITELFDIDQDDITFVGSFSRFLKDLGKYRRIFDEIITKIESLTTLDEKKKFIKAFIETIKEYSSYDGVTEQILFSAFQEKDDEENDDDEEEEEENDEEEEEENDEEEDEEDDEEDDDE
jgi:hypothetical protein